MLDFESGVLLMFDEAQIKKDLSVVCTCKGIKYRTIRLAIIKGCNDIESIRKKTKANTGCGELCTDKINKMIEDYKR